MANPSEQEIKDFVVDHCTVWMTHDKDAFVKLWKGFATKDVIFEDPVGTPPKVGWDQWSDMWDRFNPFTLEYRPERVYVCGAEAAIAFYHKMNTRGEIVEIRDIEIWKFDDGVVTVRCWWDGLTRERGTRGIPDRVCRRRTGVTVMAHQRYEKVVDNDRQTVPP